MLTTPTYYPAKEGLSERNCVKFDFIDDCLVPTSALHKASEHPKFGYVFHLVTLVCVTSDDSTSALALRCQFKGP